MFVRDDKGGVSVTGTIYLGGMSNNREPWIDPELAGFAVIILCVGILVALVGWAEHLNP